MSKKKGYRQLLQRALGYGMIYQHSAVRYQSESFGYKEVTHVPSSAIAVVLKFEELINSRSVDAIIALLTEDSVFIDSLGNKIQGTAKLRAAWAGYFKMVPDYSISHSEIFADGETVALFGSAQGTFARGDGIPISKDDFWKTPAAWRAIVKNGKIAEWQVFADNEPIRAIMRKSK